MAKKRKKILATGGAGFIGSHLVDELLNKQHEVIVIDNLCNGKIENLSNAQQSDNFTFYDADVLDKNEMKRLTINLDYIFHLACLGVRHSLHSPINNHKVNAEGTLNVLLAAVKNKVKKFFYISTSEIYGKTLEFPINEESPAFPTTIYGASKLAGEYYTKSCNERYGLDYTIIRLFNNYGPRAHFEGDSGEIIPRSIIRILYDKNPIIFGNGMITRDFLFVKDTAHILCQLLLMSNISGLTLNVGAGIEFSMKSIINNILNKCSNNNLHIEYIDARPADVPRLWVDNTKMKKILGEIKFIDINEGLHRTIGYYKQLIKDTQFVFNMKDKNWIE